MEIITDKLVKLLQYRIEQEEYSVRLYKAMSICLSYKGYKGAAALFEKYSVEEQHMHNGRIHLYLI